MRVTGWLSPSQVDLAWVALATGCLAVMVAWPSWETIPFHVIWISLTFLYGFRVWSISKTSVVLAGVAIATGASIMADAFAGSQLWGELFEVPLMSAMFVAMVWHARRRVEALATVGALADERAALLEQEERLLHDVSHELRTPVTIARGHLELLERRLGVHHPEVAGALRRLPLTARGWRRPWALDRGCSRTRSRRDLHGTERFRTGVGVRASDSARACVPRRSRVATGAERRRGSRAPARYRLDGQDKCAIVAPSSPSLSRPSTSGCR